MRCFPVCFSQSVPGAEEASFGRQVCILVCVLDRAHINIPSNSAYRGGVGGWEGLGRVAEGSLLLYAFQRFNFIS